MTVSRILGSHAPQVLWVLSAVGLLGGCAPWGTAEAMCVRLPTPDARAECVQRHREVAQAYGAEQRARAEARRAEEAQAFQRIALPPALGTDTPAPVRPRP